MSIDPTTSIIIMIASAVVFALATWRARRPYEPGPGFKLPLLPFQFLAVFFFMVGFVTWLSQA